MRHRLDLPTVLVRVRDLDGHSATVSTDSHHVRLVLRDAHYPDTEWRYIDLDDAAAAAVAAGLAAAGQSHPYPGRLRRLFRRRR
ncbi:hypothetical protein [Nocardia cyriacigeorgica]|uniref:hypothetical protein n=1 Tax=Nocardia cyriacigeorgica TaxID=135487 RepID=UPI002453E92F|nr:hypothetical protein [Nocardia cyriacigeorgica]